MKLSKTIFATLLLSACAAPTANSTRCTKVTIISKGCVVFTNTCDPAIATQKDFDKLCGYE